MTWLLIAIILVLLASFLTLFAYFVAFYSSPRRAENPYKLPSGEQYEQGRELMLSLIRELDGIPFEPVTITAFDGVQLCGRYYHVRDGAPVQIELHGYRGSALRDFCGGNKLAREAGMNTLLVDERANGRSGGRTITFGVKERRDCLSWIEYANSRFGPVPIFLAGVSMGAATVLMAAGLPLPANVAGIIADCPYSSPEAIIRKVCREDMHLPPALLMPFVRLAARLFGRFRLDGASAVEAARDTGIPILLLHGEDDRFVPCGMSREIHDAAPGSTLVTFPGAGHGLSYIVDGARYAAAVERFILDCTQRLTGETAGAGHT